ncbi:hypothetical protein ACC754_37945, partial [Rhizobium johnstonii]
VKTTRLFLCLVAFLGTSPPFDQQPAHSTPDLKDRKAVRRSAADWAGLVDFRSAHELRSKALDHPPADHL